jgi:hypothetical protein
MTVSRQQVRNAAAAVAFAGAMLAASAAPAHADSEITIERVVTCQRMVGSVCESTLVCWVQSNGYWWCENGQSGGRVVPGKVILD